MNNILKKGATKAWQLLLMYVLLFTSSCSKDDYNNTFTKADFTTAIQGLSVTFHNQTLRADSCQWDFGDGQKSIEFSPVHTYARSDYYSITMRAYRDGKVAAMKSVMLTAGTISGFRYEVETDGLTVKFTNQSENGVSYQWDFNDGSTAEETSPTHTYLTYGRKNVLLKVIGAAGDTAKALVPVLLSPDITSPITAWDKVTAAITRDAANVASKMFQLKMAYNNKYLFLYCEFDKLTTEELKNTPVGFFMDADGNTTTGNQGVYGAGCDTFIDGPLFSTGGSMFDSALDGGGWDWKNYRPTLERIKVSDIATLPNKHAAVVLAIDRNEMLPFGSRVGAGLSFSGSSWGFTPPWTNLKAYLDLATGRITFERFPQ